MIMMASLLTRRLAIGTHRSTTAQSFLCRSWHHPHVTRLYSSDPQVLLERLTQTSCNDDDDDDDPTTTTTTTTNTITPQIARITLNRPQAANAMGSQMIHEFQACLKELERPTESSRAVVLTSSSTRFFSAGADLKERRNMSLEQAELFVALLRLTFQQVADLPLPVIAAMEGVAVGGGLELALAADLRVASETALLGLPETSLAIVPGAGGTQRLPRLIGVANAKEFIWTAKRIKGVDAHALGLVNRVVDAGMATQAAMELAWEIAKNGPVAIKASKDAIDRGMVAKNMEEALQVERECYARVLPTEDRLEGLKAFKEKRAPEYKGQ